MSTLVFGLNHHRTPIDLLERVSLGPAQVEALATRALASGDIDEVLVLSTCNRTEIYAEVSTFHGAVADLTSALTETTGLEADDLAEHLELQYGEAAVAHVFNVAAGLDSMAVGEAQILGQLRTALADGQRAGAVGSSLNSLVQHALRTGKRVRTQTGLEQVSRSLVTTGLALAESGLGDLSHRAVLVIGAGGMSALAAAAALRHGVASLTLVNRTPGKAEALATRLGARWRPISELADALAGADVVISATGSTGLVVSLADGADAQVARAGAPQVYLDLALPHDIAHQVADLRGVTLVGLEQIGRALDDGAELPQVVAARELVAAEVGAHLTERAKQVAGPTVAALRAAAAEVVAREIERLDQRTPDLSEADRAQVHLAVHRVVEKLLHRPTIRVKEMAVDGRIVEYEDAIRQLFDLHKADLP